MSEDLSPTEIIDTMVSVAKMFKNTTWRLESDNESISLVIKVYR